MSSSTSQVGVAFVGKDELSQVVAKVDGHLSKLDRTLTSVRGRFQTGIISEAGRKAFDLLGNALARVTNLIPDLISRGEAWARTVDEIGDATGMSAQKASEIAAVQSIVGDSTDGLARGFVLLAKNAVANGKAFAQMGIATRDSNGRMLDAYTIFQNVRERVSATGGSLLSTAAAAKVFGRGASGLLDLLTLTNGQWAIYADQARRSGLILSQAGSNAAEQWERTRHLLDMTITGLGSQILTGAAPALIALSNGVAKAIQDNMDSIVTFVVKAVNFVAGLISGFLGIDLAGITVASRIEAAGNSAGRAAPKIRDFGKAAQQAAAGTGSANGPLQRQIDLIDRQLAAMDKADSARQAREQYQQTLADIHKARADLDSIRGEVILKSHMSEADAVLAQQDKAARLAEARRTLQEAEQRASDQRRQSAEDKERASLQRRRDALQAQMTRQQQAASRLTAASTDVAYKTGKAFDSIATKGLPKFTKAMQAAAADAQRSGHQIADAIQDAIFGPDQQVQIGGGPPVTFRTGGLVGVMRDVGAAIGKLAALIPGNTDGLVAVAGAIAAWKVVGGVSGAAGGLGTVLGATGLGGLVSAIVPPVAAAVATAGGVNAILDRVLPRTGPGSHGHQLMGPANPGGNNLPGWYNPADTSARLLDWGRSLLPGWLTGTDSSGTPKGAKPRPSQGRLPRPGASSFDPLGILLGGGTGAAAGMVPLYGPWFGPQGASSTSIADTPGFRNADRLFGKYLGSGSDVFYTLDRSRTGIEAGTGWAANTADNTNPIPGGIDIGGWGAGKLPTSVNDWGAGTLGVSNSNFGGIGAITKVGVKLPVKTTKSDWPAATVSLGKINIDTSAMDHRLKQINNNLTYRGYSIPGLLQYRSYGNAELLWNIWDAIAKAWRVRGPAGTSSKTS